MDILLNLLLLGYLSVANFGHPILEAPESVIGPWKGDVNIPCSYDSLKGYIQVLMRWRVQHDSYPVTIFRRDSSGDHIQQSKYRRRLQVSHEVPGNVSLQLNTLEMDDQSHYTCEVTWQTPDGKQVVRDKIIDLRVQKWPVSKPTVTTGSSYGFTVPQGMKTSLQCQAWGSPPINYVWYKEQTNGQEPIKIGALSTLLFKPAVVADSGSYFCTAKGRVGSEQRSDIVKFVVKVVYFPSSLNKNTGRTMTSNSNSTGIGVGKGRGLPVFAIILIITLCCVLVLTMAYVILCQKTSRQETSDLGPLSFLEHVYEVNGVHANEVGDSEKTVRVAVFTSGCSSDKPASQALSNNYSDGSCLDQEYQIITPINGDCTCLLQTDFPDYEV
ncbi:V-set and immunoglobulin domain-containing protein 4 [Ctenodactylus gundi]